MLHAGHGVVGMGRKQDVRTSHHDKFDGNVTAGSVGRNDRTGRIDAQLSLYHDVGRPYRDALTGRGRRKVQKTLNVEPVSQIDDLGAGAGAGQEDVVIGHEARTARYDDLGVRRQVGGIEECGESGAVGRGGQRGQIGVAAQRMEHGVLVRIGHFHREGGEGQI